MRSLVVAVVLAWPAGVWAQGADPDGGGEVAPPPPAEAAPLADAAPVAASRSQVPPPEPVSTDHRRQFGLSARFAFRMRGIATYDDDYCGDRSDDTASGFAAVCMGRAPMSLDLEMSYGIARRKELLLEIRLGLERDFGAFPGDDGPRQLMLAPGARFFFSEAKTAKLFTTVQGVLDFSGYEKLNGDSRGVDYGLRNVSGLWFDLHHAYGFYVFIAETLTFDRWLLGELELGVGFQGRYP